MSGAEPAAGGVALQRCAACGRVQYPPRACCAHCLSDRLEPAALVEETGTLLARAVLHHSLEPRFRPRLPLGLAFVRLDAGPVVLCFAPASLPIGARVTIRAAPDEEGRALLAAA